MEEATDGSDIASQSQEDPNETGKCAFVSLNLDEPNSGSNPVSHSPHNPRNESVIPLAESNLEEILEYQGPVYYLVLGSQINTKYGPGRMRNRVHTAAALLAARIATNSGQNDVIFFSGGKTTKGMANGPLSELTEAQFMKNYLEELLEESSIKIIEGEDHEAEEPGSNIQLSEDGTNRTSHVRVVLDNYATSTRENLEFISRYINEKCMLVIFAGEIAPAASRVKAMTERLNIGRPGGKRIVKAIEDDPEWFNRFLISLKTLKIEETIREMPIVEDMIELISRIRFFDNYLRARARKTRLGN